MRRQPHVRNAFFIEKEIIVDASLWISGVKWIVSNDTNLPTLMTQIPLHFKFLKRVRLAANLLQTYAAVFYNSENFNGAFKFLNIVIDISLLFLIIKGQGAVRRDGARLRTAPSLLPRARADGILRASNSSISGKPSETHWARRNAANRQSLRSYTPAVPNNG